MLTPTSILFATVLALLAVSCDAHGRLVSPVSRGGTGYEDDPVPGLGSENFVCRHATKKPEVPIQQWKAGGTVTLKWAFGANHLGDCALFLSYDVFTARADQKFFKIANLPECNQDNKEDVTVTLPSWLPAGDVVLRWDWYALHVWPGNVEFYTQCVDGVISSTSTVKPDSIAAYSIIKPPIYPSEFKTGFRNPYDGSAWFMAGPKCAAGVTGNCCDLTTYKAGTGYRKSACSGVTGVASTPTTPTTPTTPVVAPSTPATPTTQGMNRCGKDYNNAASKCGTKCPRGQDSECPSGEFCYAAIVDTLCGTTPTPPVVPPTTPTG